MLRSAALGAAALCAIHLIWRRLTRPSISAKGRHVLITGGSQGLGKALAKLFFDEGARVTIVARTASTLREVSEQIKQSSNGVTGDIQFFTLDVGSATCQQVNDLVGEAAKTFGRVDIFVANAGTGNGKLVVDTPLREMEQLLDGQLSVNLQGALKCVIAVAQLMASDGAGGRISIVSSAAGFISMPGYAIYSATKFGHRGFLAGAYDEFRRHGVYLSVYYPGSIRTPGFQAEQEAMPEVTARIESQCSDVSSADSAAKALMRGILNGSREITNEFLPSLLVDTPTGSPPLDAIIGALVQLVRAGWFFYLRIMSSMYIKTKTSGRVDARKHD